MHKVQLIRFQGNVAFPLLSQLVNNTHIPFTRTHTYKYNNNLNSFPFSTFLTHKIKAKRMTL